MYIYTYIDMFVCVCVCLYICMFICMYVCKEGERGISCMILPKKEQTQPFCGSSGETEQNDNNLKSLHFMMNFEQKEIVRNQWR